MDKIHDEQLTKAVDTNGGALMISPELLRQYPHFAGVTHDCLSAIAMASKEKQFNVGEDLIIEGHPATIFCLIRTGEVSVVYRLGDDREVEADSLISGDAFGWSALLDPFKFTATCRAKNEGEYIEIDAEELRIICDEYVDCGYQILQEVSKTLRDRLSALRVQVAARA